MEKAAEIIRKFPCCRDIHFSHLTLAQVAVVELICNLEDHSYEFNLSHALRHWSSEDLRTFWIVVKQAYQDQLDRRGFEIE